MENKMDSNNKYTEMQKQYYNSTADIMAIENHRGHDSNPDYYGLLLKEVSENPEFWKDKTALDFGCGIGRNVDNLLKLANWKEAHGCDLSHENIIRAEKFLDTCNHNNKYKFFTTSGTTVDPLVDNTYDFVMSTIVFQHIAVHQIRTSLFEGIYKIMKPGALFSFQMAQYFPPKTGYANYYDNAWDASGTNGAFDVSVSDPQNLIDDLTKIGFKNISYEIKPEWDWSKKCYMDSSATHSFWIYVKASK